MKFKKIQNFFKIIKKNKIGIRLVLSLKSFGKKTLRIKFSKKKLDEVGSFIIE